MYLNHHQNPLVILIKVQFSGFFLPASSSCMQHPYPLLPSRCRFNRFIVEPENLLLYNTSGYSDAELDLRANELDDSIS